MKFFWKFVVVGSPAQKINKKDLSCLCLRDDILLVEEIPNNQLWRLVETWFKVGIVWVWAPCQDASGTWRSIGIPPKTAWSDKRRENTWAVGRVYIVHSFWLVDFKGWTFPSKLHVYFRIIFTRIERRILSFCHDCRFWPLLMRFSEEHSFCHNESTIWALHH